MNRIQADGLLLMAALLWGVSFVFQKEANDYLHPLFFTGGRFFLAALLMAPFAWREIRRAKTPPSFRDLRLPILVGFCLFAASLLQQLGLLHTSATHGGFLTSLYVILVPFVTWMLFRQKPALAVVAGGAVSIVGAWLLTNTGKEWQWASGDALILGANFIWAFHIVLLGTCLQKGVGPFTIAFLQAAITGVLGLAASLLAEWPSWQDLGHALPALLYSGFLSGGVAFALQVMGQRHTPPAEAALIMALEGVFAALAGAILLQDRLPLAGYAGCALILLGVIAVEITSLKKTGKAR
jgi:drug/metabolite transporter (DMT)-like permease